MGPVAPQEQSAQPQSSSPVSDVTGPLTGSPPSAPEARLEGPQASIIEGATPELIGPPAVWAGEQAGPNGRPNGGSCTPAQLRRFIKSRAWVPMHELRRRFAINGSEDEMTLVEVGGSGLFIGLPDREGRILGDLLRGGEVGFELSHDPVSPVVVGVYPMRPVPRP
jgi:hypothetical protein